MAVRRSTPWKPATARRRATIFDANVTHAISTMFLFAFRLRSQSWASPSRCSSASSARSSPRWSSPA